MNRMIGKSKAELISAVKSATVRLTSINNDMASTAADTSPFSDRREVFESLSRLRQEYLIECREIATLIDTLVARL